MADTSAKTTTMPGVAATKAANAKYKCVLLFGQPGAGKGTQGKILHTIPGFYHSSTGDVFRSIDISSELGKIFYEHSSRGELVPDEVTIKMWLANISAHSILGDYKPKKDLLVLDGMPRTVSQAKILDEYIEVYKVIHLVCSDMEASVERMRRRALKENRYDDADEKVIRRRFAVYEKETRPVLEHYPVEKIVEVNSMGSPARVLRDVLDVVVPIQDRHFAKFEG